MCKKETLGREELRKDQQSEKEKKDEGKKGHSDLRMNHRLTRKNRDGQLKKRLKR